MMLPDDPDLPAGEEHIGFMREQAAKCRRLAKASTDDRTTRILTQLGEEYLKQAEMLGRVEGPSSEA